MTAHKTGPEAEWKTRKQRIDPRLDGAGWKRWPAPPSPKPFRTEEPPTAHGPADYALWLDNHVTVVAALKRPPLTSVL